MKSLLATLISSEHSPQFIKNFYATDSHQSGLTLWRNNWTSHNLLSSSSINQMFACKEPTRSTITVHPEIIDGRPGTMVIESFVVDVPEGNTKDETCYFVEALIKCNLKSLADVSERLAVQDRTEPIDRV
ncbi:Abscisic acid receptor PYL3 [Sesamum angolense]|uniref:Abscisic acid receptor PYL3 n=1 Tax=Sesamum angolense TaxID=2727404 RepID=A0AAE1T4V3_9LAMI|nr:Abscisic acid receptor PYL3 [Sesamum angolense]